MLCLMFFVFCAFDSELSCWLSVCFGQCVVFCSVLVCLFAFFVFCDCVVVCCCVCFVYVLELLFVLCFILFVLLFLFCFEGSLKISLP